MNGTYYVIKDKDTGKSVSPSGVSKAPHLYLTEGKANGMLKKMWLSELYEVVPVELKELVKGGV